jgi:hypothetical protein
MRKAYSGRAAAYEKKGAYDLALGDYKMLVLYYALENEILAGLQSDNRDKLLGETANAYRARGRCLELLSRTDEARLDRKRADSLDAEAKKLPTVAQSPPTNPSVEVKNAWSEPVTLMIDGVALRLQVGEQRRLAVPSGTLAFEMVAGPYRTAGTLQAGKTYVIGANAGQAK